MRNSLTDTRHLLGLALLAGTLSCGDQPMTDPLEATTLVANSPTLMSSTVDSLVPAAPSVLLQDQHGDPLPGIVIDFAVTAGGGEVTGAHPTTDSLGVATVTSWRLGPDSGMNVLTASMGDLTPVVFTATGAPAFDPCSVRTPLPWNTSTVGTLSLEDCTTIDSIYSDLYTVDLDPNAYAYAFHESAAFDAYLTLYDTTGRPVAFNDDSTTWFSTNSAFTLLVPPGPFLLKASSYLPHTTGDYTVSVKPASAQVSNCRGIFTIVGVVTDQALLLDDCRVNGAPRFSDRYWIYLDSAQQVTITETAANPAYFDALVAVYDGLSGQLLDSNDDASDSTTNARLQFTAPTPGYYLILATTTTDSTTGYYAFSIQASAPAPGAHRGRRVLNGSRGAALPSRLEGERRKR